MQYVLYAIIFVLGLLMGSFINVVILRFGKKSFTKGRSECVSCRKKLNWYELIPIFSFILQKGCCRRCKKSLLIQYPVVEFSTGILFLLNFIKIFDLNYSFWLSVIIYLLTTTALAILIVIFVYDLYHKIIPDVFSFSFGFLGMFFAFLVYFGDVLYYGFDLLTIDLFAPLIFFIPFYLLWRLSRGRLIGLGDGKLVIGIGAFLGVAHGLSALFLSFWIGAVVAGAIVLIGRLKEMGSKLTMKSEIAFGPFMIVGFLLVYFLEIDVSGLSLILSQW